MFNKIRVSFQASKNTLVGRLRNVSSGNAASEEKYALGMQLVHWSMAGSVLACVGLVNVAQFYKGKKKMEIMHYHKSFGLLAAGLVGPTLLMRAVTKIPSPVSGSALEQIAAKAGHLGLYAFMIIMPATGVAMGYFGGKGLPFFTTTIAGADKANGDIAKPAFKVHSNFGHYAQYLIPMHVGAVGFHYLVHGKNILPRMLPWK